MGITALRHIILSFLSLTLGFSELGPCSLLAGPKRGRSQASLCENESQAVSEPAACLQFTCASLRL